MFIVTNREIREEEKGLDVLGARPSAQGPNELRLVEAERDGKRWKLRVLPNHADAAMKAGAGITDPDPVFASRYVAVKVLEHLRARKRNLLFFVHGYNNDIGDVLERAEGLERTYKVEVLAFSWPANGGGTGVASYLSDKRDALASAGALGRCLEKLHEYLTAFNAARLTEAQAKAKALPEKNAGERDELISEEIEQGCPFTVNLMLHSMGNYLLKHVLSSSVHEGGRKLVFDNVTMVAADANNEGHAEWVDRIQCRRRLYITINEHDGALMVSRMKVGDQQKARLGHYPFNLNSTQAVYVNFTEADKVGKSHAYFEGTPITNVAVRKFFRKAFNGERAEADLVYDPARNLYHPA